MNWLSAAYQLTPLRGEYYAVRKDREATLMGRFEDARSWVDKQGRERLVGLDWRNRKEELFKRCGGRCEQITWMRDTPSGPRFTGCYARCASSADDAHHIIPRSKGRDDRLANLQALCRYHHDLLDPRKIISDKVQRRAK